MSQTKRKTPNFKKLVYGVSTGLALSFAFQSTAWADSEAYIELKEPRMLRFLKGNILQKRLANATLVDAGTILALDVEKLSYAIEQQRLNPNDVNFIYVTEKGEQRRSSSGVVCGVRIVDVPDEDQRVSDFLNRSDYCLSLEVVRNSINMAGNSSQVMGALQDLTEKNDGKQMAMLAEDLRQNPLVEVAENMIDPLIDFVGAGSGFSKPLDGSLKVTSNFGYRIHPVHRTKKLHKGMDLRASSGSTVRSALPGTVLSLRSERVRKKNGKLGNLKGYGHYVIVVHPKKKMQTLYAHLSKFKSTEGEVVQGGTRIALSGNTGVGTGPHLHFETHVGGTPKDPRNYIANLLSQLDLFIEKFMIG